MFSSSTDSSEFSRLPVDHSDSLLDSSSSISAESWPNHPICRRLAALRPTKRFGPPVISLSKLVKSYQLPGSDEKIRAIKQINLTGDSEIYPILEGEFLMIRGPSGGGKKIFFSIREIRNFQ